MTMAPMAPREDVEIQAEGNVGNSAHSSHSAPTPPVAELTENNMAKTDEADDTKVGSSEEDIDNAGDDSDEQQLCRFMKGINADLRARGPLYKSDWGRPRSIFKVLNATIFAFVIQLIPALIFAELMDRQTEGNLATAETLLSSAIIGIIYAIFAGQPLVIMGITGPVSLLLGTSYGLTEQFDAEYFPFFFWICIWAGLMHIISSMVGLVHLVWKVTPFTSQIFEFFIAVTFLYASIRDLIEPIYLGQGAYQADRSAQYATLMLGLITFYVAWTLHFAEQWVVLTRPLRTFLSSYNTLIACVVATALSYLPGVDLAENGAGGLDRVNLRTVPWDWTPTADRPWITDPTSGIDIRGIFAAIIPGFMFFLLFIIDHNVSSILTQSPKYNLKKPPAYHWDFFVLGVTFIPCAILGLPPGNGLIPQAPLHARALCTRKYSVDNNGRKHEIVTHCEEQRWSGLGQALLMLASLACFEVISWIPRGCLFGLFAYLGMGALHGNEIFGRIVYCFMIPKNRPDVPIIRRVKWPTVQVYTFIQATCGLAVFAVGQFTSVGYIYPALLTALVPVRSYILSRFFNEKDLKYLDPTDETEEELRQEIRARHLLRNDSFDSAATPPHFGQFHPNAMRNELRMRKPVGDIDDVMSLPADVQA